MTSWLALPCSLLPTVSVSCVVACVKARFADEHKATIIDFDQIIVMEDGMLVESGPPQELLAVPNGRFASLASSQGLIKLESDITEEA